MLTRTESDIAAQAYYEITDLINNWIPSAIGFKEILIESLSTAIPKLSETQIETIITLSEDYSFPDAAITISKTENLDVLGSIINQILLGKHSDTLIEWTVDRIKTKTALLKTLQRNIDTIITNPQLFHIIPILIKKIEPDELSKQVFLTSSLHLAAKNLPEGTFVELIQKFHPDVLNQLPLRPDYANDTNDLNVAILGILAQRKFSSAFAYLLEQFDSEIINNWLQARSKLFERNITNFHRIAFFFKDPQLNIATLKKASLKTLVEVLVIEDRLKSVEYINYSQYRLHTQGTELYKNTVKEMGSRAFDAILKDNLLEIERTNLPILKEEVLNHILQMTNDNSLYYLKQVITKDKDNILNNFFENNISEYEKTHTIDLQACKVIFKESHLKKIIDIPTRSTYQLDDKQYFIVHFIDALQDLSIDEIHLIIATCPLHYLEYAVLDYKGEISILQMLVNKKDKNIHPSEECSKIIAVILSFISKLSNEAAIKLVNSSVQLIISLKHEDIISTLIKRLTVEELKKRVLSTDDIRKMISKLSDDVFCELIIKICENNPLPKARTAHSNPLTTIIAEDHICESIHRVNSTDQKEDGEVKKIFSLSDNISALKNALAYKHLLASFFNPAINKNDLEKTIYKRIERMIEAFQSILDTRESILSIYNDFLEKMEPGSDRETSIDNVKYYATTHRQSMRATLLDLAEEINRFNKNTLPVSYYKVQFKAQTIDQVDASHAIEMLIKGKYPDFHTLMSQQIFHRGLPVTSSFFADDSKRPLLLRNTNSKSRNIASDSNDGIFADDHYKL